MYSITGTTLLGVTKNTAGLFILVQAPTAGMTLPTTADVFATGCICVNIADGSSMKNVGTSAVPVWMSTSVLYKAITATSDGTGAGAIPVGTTFAAVTSSGATQQVALPAISASTIGQTVDIHVGSNGYELITPASSNNTINTVDADGTNQLDVAANTLLRCVQVSATGWVAYQVAATTITVVAPDND